MNNIKNTIKKSENYKYWLEVMGSTLLQKLQNTEEYNHIFAELLEKEKFDKSPEVLFANRDELCIKSERKVVFSPIKNILFAYAKQLLVGEISSQYIDEKVINHLSNDFIQGIEESYIRIFLQEIKRQEKGNKLQGESGNKQYDNYINLCLQDREYLNNIFKKYPVWIQIILDKIHSFVNYIDKVLYNMELDKNAITKKFCHCNDFSRIIEIKINMSDEHYSGKTVLKIKLNNGYTIYYKPHNLDNVINFNKINSWIHQQCKVEYYERLIIDCDGYGWELEVPFQECSEETEIQRFYRRMGIQLCLAYILNISDLHYENLIACGEHPVIIDLEVFPDMRLSSTSKYNAIHKMLKKTAMNTGLLPGNAWGQKVNVSALGEEKVQKSPFKVPVVSNKGTSEMYIYYDYPTINMFNNIPALAGKKRSYENYIDCILSGFVEAYEKINFSKEKFQLLLEPVFEQKTRYLFRSTQEYKMYQNISYFPEMLKNNEYRYLALFRMDRGLFCNELYRYQVLKYEMNCIFHFCIPVFYAKGRDLYLGNGMILNNYFEQSGKKVLMSQMEQISEKDLDLQKRVVIVSFLSVIKKRRVKTQSILELLNVPDQYLSQTFAELIISNKLKYESEVGWIGIHYRQTQNAILEPINMYLYDGIAGIAIFMNAISYQYPRQKYNELCQQINEKLFAYTDSLIGDKKKISKCSWGLFTGEASLIYTYILLYRITKEHMYMCYAEKQSQFVINNLNIVKGADLLDGKAGIVMVMLFMYEETGRRMYLNVAVQVADELLNMCITMKPGIGWLINGQNRPLAGLAHGNSGIAMALAKLWVKTKKEKYYRAVLQAIEYENTLFDETKGNWMDIRGEENICDTSGWCHGAPGILICRMEIQKNMKEAVPNLFIEHALLKSKNSQSAEACLCHGYVGIHEILKVCEKENNNTLCINRISVEDFINPGFMTGNAGIGYALLRDKNPSLPSLICFL